MSNERTRSPRSGGIEVLLHQAKRDARAAGETLRQRHRFILQLFRIDGAVDDAEALGFLGKDHVGEQVELLGLGDAHELGKEICAAEVAGEADLGEGGGDLRVARGDAEVAGQRDGEPGAGRRARDGGDGDLWHVVQPA